MANINYLRLRGLPFSSSEVDIFGFLKGLPIRNEQSVIITINEDGRPSGEALVKLDLFVNLNDLRTYNGRYMGNRFIEVFPSSQSEYYFHENRQQLTDMTLVRLRGLPYDVTNEDIFMFFSGLVISRGGVVLMVGPDDVPTGEAFVQFMTREDANMALQRHNQSIRSRYIEVYKSTLTDTVRAIEREMLKRTGNMPVTNQGDFGGPMKRARSGNRPRSGPYNPKNANNTSQNNIEFTNGDDKTIFMRGLPYSATEQDINDFFTPLALMSVNIFRSNDGRLTGEAAAEFMNQDDAIEGMKKDRCKIGWRYIELFTQAP